MSSLRVVAVLIALATPAAATPASIDRHSAPPSGGAARVGRADPIDWASGLVTADGIGLADRHAPNPAVARGTARRGAEAAARKQLAAKIATLPLARGGTVGDARNDKAVAARLDAAVEQALTVNAEPETDGAWTVTLAVPIEAIRQAIDGPRTLAAGASDTGAPVLVIDAVSAKPAVGWSVGGTAAATVWVDTVPAWAKDAPHLKATAAKAGQIEVSGTNGTAATLYVIVTAK